MNKIIIGKSEYYVKKEDNQIKIIRASTIGETDIVIYDDSKGIVKSIAYNFIINNNDYIAFILWVYQVLTGFDAGIDADILRENMIKNRKLNDIEAFKILNKLNGEKLKC